MLLRIKSGTISNYPGAQVPTRAVPSKPGALDGSAEGSLVGLSLPDGFCHSKDRKDPKRQKPGAEREDRKPTPHNHIVQSAAVAVHSFSISACSSFIIRKLP